MVIYRTEQRGILGNRKIMERQQEMRYQSYFYFFLGGEGIISEDYKQALQEIFVNMCMYL